MRPLWGRPGHGVKGGTPQGCKATEAGPGEGTWGLVVQHSVRGRRSSWPVPLHLEVNQDPEWPPRVSSLAWVRGCGPLKWRLEAGMPGRAKSSEPGEGVLGPLPHAHACSTLSPQQSFLHLLLPTSFPGDLLWGIQERRKCSPRLPPPLLGLHPLPTIRQSPEIKAGQRVQLGESLS